MSLSNGGPILVPPGFNTVTPYFFVQEADRFIEFLVRGLGGVELARHMNGELIANAHVQLGTSTVMISEATINSPAMSSSYYLYVDSADETMQTAIDAGGAKIMEVQDMPYNDRQGGIRDPFGNIWWVSQRLIDGPYSAP